MKEAFSAKKGIFNKQSCGSQEKHDCDFCSNFRM